MCQGKKLLVLGMVIQPLIGNPYNGYINPYYWIDDHPLLYGNIGSLDPSTYHPFNESIHKMGPRADRYQWSDMGSPNTNGRK